MRPRAINVKVLPDYQLLITFDNDELKIFDVKPYLQYPQFATLKDPTMFSTVKIDGLSIAWENGADICPDELYYNSKKQK